MKYDLRINSRGQVQAMARGFFESIEAHSLSDIPNKYETFTANGNEYRVLLPAYPDVKSNWNDYNKCVEYINKLK